MKIKDIAITINELEDMPNDKTFEEACILVAMDLYNLNYKDATKVANEIQKLL